MINKLDGILALIFFFFAAFYIGFIHKLPWTGDFIIKAIPIWALAVTAWKFIPGSTGKILAAGFMLSSGGDISLSFEGENMFIMGLGFFLVAHITYIIAFSRKIKFLKTRLPFMIAIVFFAGVMAFILAPKLGEMAIPVFAYITVIATMSVFSALRPDASFFLMIGALVFMLSDSTIAVNKFLFPIPGAKYYIMITYYAGQYMICRSFIQPSAPATT